MKDCLEQLATQVAARGAVRIGVTGPGCAGKSRFAANLAKVIELGGTQVLLASVDGFHNPRARRHARGRQSPRAQADLVIDNSDFTAPKLVAMNGRAC